MNILILSLIIVMMGIGSCATVPRTILQDHTIRILPGQRLTWDHPILGKQTEYFTTFGRLARQIEDLTACVTLRTGAPVSALWHPQRLSTWQQYQKILDLGSYLKLVQMQRRCSQIRWYQYQLTTRSFSNQYKTVWKGPKRSYPIRYRQEDLQETPSRRVIVRRNMGRGYRGSTRQSTGRTRATTRTMERNYNSSFTTNPENGRGQTIYSTTGGSRKRALDLDQR